DAAGVVSRRPADGDMGARHRRRRHARPCPSRERSPVPHRRTGRAHLLVVLRRARPRGAGRPRPGGVDRPFRHHPGVERGFGSVGHRTRRGLLPRRHAAPARGRHGPHHRRTGGPEVDGSGPSVRRPTRSGPSPRLMTKRRFPAWRDLRELLQLERPRVSRSARLSSAATIHDLRRLARSRAPRAVFDYVDGAAESEVSLRRSREVYRRVEFQPRVLRDVSSVDTSTTILGRPSALPLALSPTGFTRMMHSEGEAAVAAAAAETGIPYALSTLGTTSIEDLAKAVSGGEKWFQLYVWKDRGFAKDLISRARAHGFSALILTVDTPVAGIRLRDVYNGLTIPPRLSLKTLINGAMH